MGRCKQADHCINLAWCDGTGKCLKAEPMRTPNPLPEAMRDYPAPGEKTYTEAALLEFGKQERAAERERCAHACREWQAGRLPHGIGTHDLLRAIEGHNADLSGRTRSA